MPQPQQTSRNEAIFRKVIEGVSYRSIASEHSITETRVDQIFKQEARQRLPAVFARVQAGRRYAERFLEAMKSEEQPA